LEKIPDKAIEVNMVLSSGGDHTPNIAIIDGNVTP